MLTVSRRQFYGVLWSVFGGGVGVELAELGLAGAPKSDFCSGGVFLADSSWHPTAKVAKVRTASSARNLRMVIISPSPELVQFEPNRKRPIHGVSPSTCLGRKLHAFYSPKRLVLLPEASRGNWTFADRLPTLNRRHPVKSAARPGQAVRHGQNQAGINRLSTVSLSSRSPWTKVDAV